MKENVYVIEDRAHKFIYHWLIFMISGLCDLEEQNIKKPIKFHTFSELDVQKETFDLLKPEFEFIENISEYNPIYIHGAPLVKLDLVDDKYYNFLRNTILFKNNLNIKEIPKRLLYISRNKSHELICNSGATKRQLLNEVDVYSILKNLGFEYIKLEDYNFREKIKLFQEAKLIVTPNGGALTFALFAHENTKVIEIHDSKTTNEDQYYNICKKCNIEINRYTNVTSYNKANQITQPALCTEYNLLINNIEDFKCFIENKLT